MGLVHSTHANAGSMTGLDYIYDAEVTLEGTDYKTRTNGVGLFEFRKIKPGTYIVVVKCEGFREAREEVEVIPYPMPIQVRIEMQDR